MHKTLNFHNDPGHGWLEVEKPDLMALGIAEQITPFSYEQGERVFLEEDQDAPLFMREARASGWRVETTDCYTPGSSFVRNLEPYRP